MTTQSQPIAALPLTERMSTLLRQRIPFVKVTVVRAQKPTSVRPGHEAIVLADGSIEGFIGGVCAEDSVRQAALDALADGETLLLRVLPDENEPFPAADGARVVANPCLSGGAMEMFLEPLLPPPLIAITGDSAISAALAVMAPSVGFEVATGDQSDPGDVAGAMALIVSSMGRDETGPIRAALAAGVPLIGLVASPRRGAAVVEQLNLTAEESARIRTPIGLWIGARTAEEIALSILAELIRSIRLDGLTAVRPVAPPRVTALDPVCGMSVTVTPDALYLSASDTQDGAEHWFCGPGCRDRFTASTASTA